MGDEKCRSSGAGDQLTALFYKLSPLRGSERWLRGFRAARGIDIGPRALPKKADIVGLYGQLLDFLGSEGGWDVVGRR